MVAAACKSQVLTAEKVDEVTMKFKESLDESTRKMSQGDFKQSGMKLGAVKDELSAKVSHLSG